MSAKRAHYIQIVCLIIGIAALILYYIVKSAVPLIIAGVLLLVGNAIWLIYGKCPHCGGHFWKVYPKYCPHCGEQTEDL